MVDVAVKSGAAWTCLTEGHQLAQVLLPVHVGDQEDGGDDTNWDTRAPVLLEQTEEGSPCVLTLRCPPCSPPCSPTAISRLLVVSEARTMEAYDHTGEYCATIRGERDDSVQTDRSDRGPFYKKQLMLEPPSCACEVKLLSLDGRSSVLVCRVIVGLQRSQPCAARGAGIDMQQVQCLVEEMGASLSPGAQNLMDMVHLQQKNQSSSLGGFLPLLMGGGVFSALAPGGLSNQPADSRPAVGSIRPSDEGPRAQIGATPDGSTSSSTSKNPAGAEDPANRAQLAETMSRLLQGRGPELLPVLQGLCGQVSKLRLDDATALAEREQMTRNGSWELDSAMERRLQEMEERLKEHVDRRLDALEQKLEKALLGATSGSAGGAASTGPTEQNPPDRSGALSDVSRK